ncbi:NAD-dependent epimerase/dehydratase family protein [Paenibacillus albiflavus]|uniref:NAD-dependent epimerase/dehydratase family protein n=1 Tax=Paenibacillus albiflavus TaxID=2545760 RepID=A0A4R4E678_9BACL|nr:NAD(P)H-binding protein [Paenibacillus albiflavus]TCZ73188.1 NAD-dependent epimerase/dehydratase family protein [Paenibacillus albiflavus]
MDESNRIAIIGGTGKVGRYLACEALHRGYQVRMLVRNPQNLTYRDDRIELVEGSVEYIDHLRALLKGCHTVINAFGQPPKAIPMYSNVTSNLLNLMNELTINRYIGVTGGSLTLQGDHKGLLNKLGAYMFETFLSEMITDKKREAAILQQHRSLDWTLIRLPFVTEGSAIGDVQVKLTDMPGFKISNQDIASFMIGQINDKSYIRRAPFIAT